MRFSILKLFHKSQAGFTLIELLVAIAITGIIGLGAGASTAQLLNQTTRDRDYTLADSEANNAVHWISLDALMAQTIEGCGGFPETEPLTMTWISWENKTYTVVYYIENGELRRSSSDGANASVTLIAGHISADSDKTFCSFTAGVFHVTVTSAVGQGNKAFSVSRSREVANRPKL